MLDVDLAKSWHRIFASHLTYALADLEPFRSQPKDVRNPHACKLGKWLDEMESQFSTSPAYRAVVEQHDLFHQHAGTMVERHAAGDLAGVEAVERKTFRPASEEVIAALDAFAAEYASRQTASPGAGAGVSSRTLDGILQWNDAMRLGIPVIDAQHMEITNALNHLLLHPGLDTRAEFVIDALQSLQSMMIAHFDTEEALMRRDGIDIELLAEHRKDHDRIIELLAKINFDAIDNAHLPAREIYGRVLDAFIYDLTEYDKHLRRPNPA